MRLVFSSDLEPGLAHCLCPSEDTAPSLHWLRTSADERIALADCAGVSAGCFSAQHHATLVVPNWIETLDGVEILLPTSAATREAANENRRLDDRRRSSLLLRVAVEGPVRLPGADPVEQDESAFAFWCQPTLRAAVGRQVKTFVRRLLALMDHGGPPWWWKDPFLVPLEFLGETQVFRLRVSEHDDFSVCCGTGTTDTSTAEVAEEGVPMTRTDVDVTSMSVEQRVPAFLCVLASEHGEKSPVQRRGRDVLRRILPSGASGRRLCVLALAPDGRIRGPYSRLHGGSPIDLARRALQIAVTTITGEEFRVVELNWSLFLWRFLGQPNAALMEQALRVWFENLISCSSAVENGVNVVLHVSHLDATNIPETDGIGITTDDSSDNTILTKSRIEALVSGILLPRFLMEMDTAGSPPRKVFVVGTSSDTRLSKSWRSFFRDSVLLADDAVEQAEAVLLGEAAALSDPEEYPKNAGTGDLLSTSASPVEHDPRISRVARLFLEENDAAAVHPHAREHLEHSAILQLRCPGDFARLGLETAAPKIFLHGPGGMGKTHLCHWFCARVSISTGVFHSLHSVHPSDIVSPYVGESEKNLEKAFAGSNTSKGVTSAGGGGSSSSDIGRGRGRGVNEQEHHNSTNIGTGRGSRTSLSTSSSARSKRVLVFENIDQWCIPPEDGDGAAGVFNRLLTTFLVLLDGIAGTSKRSVGGPGSDVAAVIVTTSHPPTKFASSLTRPGRLSNLVRVGQERSAISGDLIDRDVLSETEKRELARFLVRRAMRPRRPAGGAGGGSTEDGMVVEVEAVAGKLGGAGGGESTEDGMVAEVEAVVGKMGLFLMNRPADVKLEVDRALRGLLDV